MSAPASAAPSGVAPDTTLLPTPTVRPAQDSGRFAPWWALVGALLLAAIYARVAVLNLTTGVVGGDIDGYINLWDTWWLKYALFVLHRNPFFDDYIYYPTGVSLYFHTFNPINGLLVMPINQVFGYVPAMNLLLVALLAATTFCAWLFLRDLVGNGWAAFGGAALYTYANHLVVEYLTAGQTERLSAEWFPLYLFFLFRALYGRPRWSRAGVLLGRDIARWRLWAGLAVSALVGSSLADWQYTMIAVFVTLLYFAFILCTPRTRREKTIIFGKLALVGGAYTLLVGPALILPTIQDALVNPWLSVGYQSALHATDLLDLLGPGPANPGYLACLVALVGFVVAWRLRGPARAIAVFWALAALLFWIMSLGPSLIVGGATTQIPLPYSLLQNLPVFSIGRDPARYTLGGRLGVGVLAAFGLRALFDLGRQRLASPPSAFRIPHSALRILVLGVFLAVDLGGWVGEAGRAHADPPDWPPFYRQIAADPDTYALLELPLFTESGRGEDHYQMYQALHHKPRFSGHLARDRKLTNPNNFVKRASLFRDLWLLPAAPARRALYYPDHDFLQRTDYATQGRAILNYYKVGYIVVYKDALDRGWDENAFQWILQQTLGANARPYYEDPQMRVYKVPDGPPAANPLTLDVGEGWFAAETRADGTIFRLADNTAGQPSELYTMNLTQTPLPATLRFTVYPFQQARTLTVALNDSPLTTLHLNPDEGGKPVALDLTLPPGNNRITFSSPEPPLPTGNPNDGRLLTFGMYGVSLQAR